jgi:hypothetical protein
VATRNNLQTLDLLSMFSSDVFAIENQFPGAHLYKYYSFDDEFRERFLSKPTIKFARKSELNDPFELTKRWKQFGSPVTRDFAARYVTKDLKSRLKDRNYVVRLLAAKEQFKVSNLSVAQLYEVMDGPIGEMVISKLEEESLRLLPEMIDAFFSHADRDLDGSMEKILEDFGILSLTERATNRAMWGLYAGAGLGFALKFNARHAFFGPKRDDGPKRSSLLQVRYRDDRPDDFWSNPHYLFAVKHPEFSFEQEWRLLKSITTCDELALQNGSKIYTVPAPEGLITGVIFGHRTNSDTIDIEVSLIRQFDPSITAQIAVPDTSTGEYRLDDA